MQIIFRQILSVITSVSRVLSFFVKGAKYVDIAAQVVRVTEFALQVVLKAVAVADQLYSLIASRERVGLTLITAVFQLLRDSVQDYIEFFDTKLKPLITDTTNFWLQLVDAEYGWKNVNLNWISGVLTRGPNSTLAAAHAMVQSFAYGPCQLSNKTDLFTVEESGDDRIIGPWFQKGLVNKKAKYVLKNHPGFPDAERKTRIESNRRNLWSIWVLDRSFGRGWWFGWLGLGWRRLYENRINIETVPTLGWGKREGALPLPQIAIIADAGESDQ